MSYQSYQIVIVQYKKELIVSLFQELRHNAFLIYRVFGRSGHTLIAVTCFSLNILVIRLPRCVRTERLYKQCDKFVCVS